MLKRIATGPVSTRPDGPAAATRPVDERPTSRRDESIVRADDGAGGGDRRDEGGVA